MLAGTVLAAAVYGRRRLRETSTPATITERDAAAFLVRRPVDPDGLEAVRETVAERISTGDPEAILGLEGASTASLLLDSEGERPELVWYVEVPRSVVDRWADPRATVAGAFPVESDALEDEPAVDRELLVHAVNPTRPRTVAGADGPLVAGPEGVGVDVDLVEMRLESGVAERLADRFAGLCRRIADGECELGPIERWSAEMLEAEEMYTESVFLERREEGYALVGYMETAAMGGVYDAYYDTYNPVARASEVVLGWVLEEPTVILEYPLETGVTLLAHAVDPERPRRPAEC